MYNANKQRTSLSIIVVSTLLFWYMAVLGSLTVFTHIAQIFSIPFRHYSTGSLLITITVSVGVLFFFKKRTSAALSLDLKTLLFVLLLAVIGGTLSVSIRRVGRISPDEYLYGANSVYLSQHPSEQMGFEDRTLYNGVSPFFSVSYLTAGAYEYIVGSFALLLGAKFTTTYYLLAASIAGGIIPLCLFLALTQFSETTDSAAAGTFFILCAIVMLGEAVWTPGAYSFVRIFEGKIIFLFAGVPLFVFFSLELLKRNELSRWFQLFALSTASAGLSSSSIMVLPVLGVIMFLTYWATFAPKNKPLKEFLVHSISYFSCLLYLALFAIFVASTDTIEKGVSINGALSENFGDYVSGFINAKLPITPVLVVLSSLVVLFLIKGKPRLFLFLWMLFAFLFALNPVSAQFLLLFFRGIYFRLFYVFPFLINIGVIFSSLFTASQGLSRNSKWMLWTGIGGGCLLVSLLMPSSIFRQDRYVKGSTIDDEDLVFAQSIIKVAPKGVMVAPYPISGAVSLLDSDYPQLVSRDDNMTYLLGSLGRKDELELRLGASAFLLEDQDAFQLFTRLIDQYPEVRSIVVTLGEFKNNKSLQIFLQQKGFLKSKRAVRWIVVWR